MYAAAIAPFFARRGIHYGWVMVALTFLVTLSTAAAMGLPGVLIAPLHAEFGWEVGAISAPLGLRFALFGLTAPFAAALLQRYGVTRMVPVAVLLIVAGTAASTLMTQAWHLWASWGVVLGIAPGLTALVLGATVANRWFTARRGLVLGLLTAANATGQLLLMPVAGWLAEHVGWRVALVPAVGMAVVGLILMVLFGANHPGALGLAAYGESTVVPPPPRAAGGVVRNSFIVLREAAGTRIFWVLFFSFFVCGLSTGGLVQTHFIGLCIDMGQTATLAASMMALIGAFDFVGTIASGWLTDRYDSRWLLLWYYGLRGLSLLWLPYSDFSLLSLGVFAVFYGLDWIATIPPTVRLAAQGFGRERAPLVFGWVFTGHQLGAAVAAYGAGLSRDALASYLPAFAAAGVMCIVAAASVMAIRRRVAV